MLQPYPVATEFPQDAAAERNIAAIKAAILGARQIRGQLDIPQSREIVIHYQSPHADDQHSLAASVGVIKSVGRSATCASSRRESSCRRRRPPASSSARSRRRSPD
jgi:valyl-tRNA synthetase